MIVGNATSKLSQIWNEAVHPTERLRRHVGGHL